MSQLFTPSPVHLSAGYAANHSTETIPVEKPPNTCHSSPAWSFQERNPSKKDTARVQHGSNHITLCTWLEPCSPLVLLLVGQFAQTKQIFFLYLCAQEEHASSSKLQAAHGKRWSCRHLQMNSRRWVPREGLCSVRWSITQMPFVDIFPIRTECWRYSVAYGYEGDWGIKDRVFFSLIVYRACSCYDKIWALMNGSSTADPSLDRAWHWLWGCSQSNAGEL